MGINLVVSFTVRVEEGFFFGTVGIVLGVLERFWGGRRYISC